MGLPMIPSPMNPRVVILASCRRSAPAVRPQPAEPLRVLDREADAVAELAGPVGHDGDAPLAGVPVAGREVEEGLGEAVRPEPFGELLLGEGVGEPVLDAGEAGPRR